MKVVYTLDPVKVFAFVIISGLICNSVTHAASVQSCCLLIKKVLNSQVAVSTQWSSTEDSMLDLEALKLRHFRKYFPIELTDIFPGIGV